MQFRNHALLPLATAAAVCLCVPSAGASVARTAVSSRTLVSGSQSTSVVSIAIGHNRVPTRGGHGGRTMAVVTVAVTAVATVAGTAQGTPDQVLRIVALSSGTFAQVT